MVACPCTMPILFCVTYLYTYVLIIEDVCVKLPLLIYYS